MMRRVLFAVLAMLVAAPSAAAHEVRPAYLEITERGDGAIDVLFKQPAGAAQIVRLEPRLAGAALGAPTEVFAGDGFQTRIWRSVPLSGGALGGRSIGVAGLDRTITDALLAVQFADGHRLQARLTPERPSLELGVRGDDLSVLTYLRLGVDHILSGYDHLLFVAGLVLLVSGVWRLVKVISAFTAAHSITLAATALGAISVESAKIEVLVALSILFVAVELMNIRRGRTSLTQRWPWLIAFAFGLLHGAAFAGALAEIGLPRENIAGALLLFNLGVEIGQVLFVAAALALGFVLRRTIATQVPRLGLAATYVIGVAACFWLFERLQAAIVS